MTARTRSRVVQGVLAIAAVAAIAVAAFALLTPPAVPADLPVDMAGRPVVPDVVPTPVSGDTSTPSGIGQFQVPSTGLDVPLGVMDVVSGTIDPPGFTSAYWIRSMGVSPANAADGTVYVAMHSLRNGGIGPGNYLIDVERGRSSLAVGDVIEAAGASYRVTGARDVLKRELGADAELWSDKPGRLVVITCLQRPEGGPSTHNVVIEATLAASAAG
jgi:hypothetical protein